MIPNSIPFFYILHFFITGGIFFVYLNLLGIEVIEGSDCTLEKLFFAYFLGLVINRIGSIIFEPILKKIGITSIERSVYLYAELKDTSGKLRSMADLRDSYRTCCALCFIMMLSPFIFIHFSKIGLCNSCAFSFSSFLLFILFFLSYWKQNKYVNTRSFIIYSEGIIDKKKNIFYSYSSVYPPILLS